MLRYLGRADVVLVAFRGHEILPLCRLLTRKPVIFDAFVSVYDTLCLDRKRVRFDSPAGKMLKWYDAFLCRLADEVLVDTEAHAGFFRKEFGVRNVRYLYLESPDMFRPQAAEKTPGRFTVFWYGNCWPLQGVDVILGAAGILRAESGIVFRLVGPVRKKYKALVGRLECRNVEFVDHVPYVSLPGEISRADVCLGGHFSNIPKAGRVIAGKTFQFIACGKKTIVGDNPANRELFEGTPGVYFVEMGLPEALAECVRRIREE
jgi:glycosyltransferase involved in cell wall biosynthesis